MSIELILSIAILIGFVFNVVATVSSWKQARRIEQTCNSTYSVVRAFAEHWDERDMKTRLLELLNLIDRRETSR